MFEVDADKTIHLNRGDIANIKVTANMEDGTPCTFKVGDVVRFHVYKKKDCACTVIRKDVVVDAETQAVTIALTKADTKIGDIINKPTDYWYEIELNPDTYPQTLIGYDKVGEKIFRLYPEGSDINE